MISIFGVWRSTRVALRLLHSPNYNYERTKKLSRTRNEKFVAIDATHNYSIFRPPRQLEKGQSKHKTDRLNCEYSSAFRIHSRIHHPNTLSIS